MYVCVARTIPNHLGVLQCSVACYLVSFRTGSCILLLLCKDRQPSPVYDKAVVEMTSKCILVENLTISEQKVTFREEKIQMLLTYVRTYTTSHSLNPAYILNMDQCMQYLVLRGKMWIFM